MYSGYKNWNPVIKAEEVIGSNSPLWILNFKS